MNPQQKPRDHEFETVEIFRPEIVWERQRCVKCGTERTIVDNSGDPRAPGRVDYECAR